MRGKLWLGAASVALLTFGNSSAFAQSADPAGDASTQAQITAGQPVDGEIAPAGDSDWYRLHVERGQNYHITLNGGAGDGDTHVLDPTLTIHAPNGDQLAFNDDTEGSLNSALNYAPAQTGDVFVEARAFSEDATGRYHLEVTATALPPDTVGNDASTRARINAGTPVQGSLDYAGDVDWYRFSAREGQMYTITLVGAEGDSGLADPLLRIVDAHGTEIAVNDDSDNSLNSELRFVPAHSGDVFISAQSYADQGVGGYTLSVAAQQLPPDEASASNNTRGRIDVGGHVDGGVDYPGDHDWYRIRLEGGHSYRFMLNGSGASALADPLLRLRDASGAEVAMDDDGGEGFNSYLEFTAPTTGNYYLDAQGYDETATGHYTLSAAAGDIPGDASTDVALAADGDSRDGALSPAGDTDWYRINLASGQGMRIAVNAAEGENALSDPLIILHGPDGAELARDDDSGGGLNSWLEFQAPAAGAYYLEVRGFASDAQGHYSITLTPGEIGNTADTAEQVQPGGSGREGTINSNGDVDWFAIAMVEGRPYRINVQGAETDALANPMLTLYDSDGKVVASDDDGGTGANSYLNFASAAGGIYYAAVSSHGNTGTGRYHLTVSDTDVAGNTGTDEALDAAHGDDRTSSIEMPGDLDDYRVDLEAGVHYVISVSATGEHPLGDPYLAILNGDGERVTADDDSGPNLDARLRFTPTEAGTYFIQASGLGDSTGSYKVSIVRQ